jgi:autotransporter passenger strand-loop-strand repeat protein
MGFSRSFKSVPLAFVIGVLFISSSNQIVYAKCTKEVTKGMVVKNEVISAGETQTVWNNGETENVTVEAGGRQLVYAGGKTTGTTVNAYGFQYVGKGGGAEKTIVKASGVQVVRGVGFNTTISGGVQVVTGTIVGTKIEKGGIQFVDWTAKNIAFTVIDKGIQHIDLEASGSDKKVKLNKGGIRNIYTSSPFTTTEYDIIDPIEIGR